MIFTGITLHCAFRLPPNQQKEHVGTLNASTLNSLRTSYSNLEMVIIDEISMTSLKHMEQIDCRLRQIFGTNEPFGGIHVLVFGDFYQVRIDCLERNIKPIIHRR